MKRPLSLWLATALMMFPQIVETIYSPALPNIAFAFNVPAEAAAQTLSFYFFAFAFGVVFWGRMCDTLGRRPAMLSGLLLYGIASCATLFTTQFGLLLALRMLSAFGAAVGSIGTQTAMRDSYQDRRLSTAFSVMGIALAISPALGMLAGAALVSLGGYRAVFAALALLALILLIWSAYRLPETRPDNVTKTAFFATLNDMLCDKEIWRSVTLIACFNINLFSYYQLAPFHFEQLALSQRQFGITGVLLAVGIAAGAVINRVLLTKRWTAIRSIRLACLISLVSACLILTLIHSGYFAIAAVGIMTGYGLAIPNILAYALNGYGDRRGTAGAILGLLYYIGLALGLVIAGWAQHYGWVVVVCSCVLTLSAKRR